MSKHTYKKAILAPQKHLALNQLIRYGLVGFALNAFYYLLYLVVTSYALGPKTCMTVIYILGTVASTLINRTWTFKSTNPLSLVMLQSVAVYFLGYLINLSLLYWLVDVCGYPHQIIQLIAIGITAMCIFLSFKLLIFKDNNPMPGQGDYKTKEML